MKPKGRARCIPKDREAVFLQYQNRWIRDDARIKLMEKSRQIGLSWSTAFGVDERVSAKGARLDEWVSSRDDIQARLFIEDCKLWAGVMGMAARDLGEVVLDAAKKHSAYVLEFASGRRIHSMSSNPDAQAGKRGSRILDEFALHKDQRKMWAVAYPGITWGGNMEIISTHRGSNSFFNQLVREARHGGNPKGISLHRVTLQDALDEGFLYKLQQALPSDAQQQAMDEAQYFDFIRAGAADEESFAQEYQCEPADDDSKFLDYELIAACQYPAALTASISGWQSAPSPLGGRVVEGRGRGRVAYLPCPLWEKYSNHRHCEARTQARGNPDACAMHQSAVTLCRTSLGSARAQRHTYRMRRRHAAGWSTPCLLRAKI
jgi:phage FluMu gp28-like protein